MLVTTPEATGRVPDARAAPPGGGGAASGRRRFGALAGDVLLVVAAVLLVAAALLYGGLRLIGYRFYEVTSTSMEPTFSRGDVVASHTVAAHNVEAGDVIVFRRDGSSDPVVHRVVRVKSDPDIQTVLNDASGKVLRTGWTYAPRTFYTQGDGNNAEDTQPVEESELIGEERFRVPWPLDLLATSINRTLLVVVGVGAIGAYVAWEVSDMGRAILRRRRARGRGDAGGASP